ncbi:MAG: FBP domain-containing protein [Bdellovibrio sp.]
MTPSQGHFQKEHFFTIASEEELIQSFRPRDQKKLILPGRLPFPIKIQSYLAWQEPSGVYTYLIFKMPNWDLPRGVTFKRTHGGGELAGGLCGWCHSYGTSEEIAFLSVMMDPNVSQSYLLCQDLRCIEKIEETAMRGGKDPDKYIAELYYRMEKLFENLSGYKSE